MEWGKRKSGKEKTIRAIRNYFSNDYFLFVLIDYFSEIHMVFFLIQFNVQFLSQILI